MKWLGYLSKLLLSVLLISWLSVFTTAYIVDLYINQLIAQWGTGGMNKPTIDAADYVSKLVNPSRLLESEQSLDSSPTKETDTNESDLHSPEDPGLPVFNQETPSELDQDGTENQQQAGHLTSELNDEQSGGVLNDQSTDQSTDQSDTSRDPSINSDAIKDTLVMSAQEFNEKRKKLSQEDKTEIFSIVITKLPQKELQKMSLILEDGITEEELVDLEDVINAYLEHEEVEKLLTILNKY